MTGNDDICRRVQGGNLVIQITIYLTEIFTSTAVQAAIGVH